MRVMEALTKLVIGMSRFGDHLLRQKVRGIIVASLAFGCGAGLAYALKREPAATFVAPAATSCGAPDSAEVSMRDTRADGDEEREPVFEGRYVNYGYGYSVEIPYGIVGVGSRPHAPQHGFGIDLDHPRSTGWGGAPGFPKSYLYADGSYNSLEWSRNDAVDYQLRYLRQEGASVRVRSRTATRLGGVRAVRVVALYVQGGEEMVSDFIVALTAEGEGDPSPVYTLALSTPLAKYERDRPVLEAMQQSWCLQPVE